jgi:hypothetical protein
MISASMIPLKTHREPERRVDLVAVSQVGPAIVPAQWSASSQSVACAGFSQADAGLPRVQGGIHISLARKVPAFVNFASTILP